jgi:hypothetical protein
MNTCGQLALVSCRDSEGLEEEDVVEQEDGVGHEGVLNLAGIHAGKERGTPEELKPCSASAPFLSALALSFFITKMVALSIFSCKVICKYM